MYICIRAKRVLRGFLAAAACFLAFFCGVNAEEAKVENGIFLPVIMYHSILRDSARGGMYVVSPSTLESDMRWLDSHGYNTVLTSDLVDYIQNDIPLPEKPVMLTFDDGYYNNLTYALPLLEKYDMHAVISVVGSYTEKYSAIDDAQPAYAHLSWKDLSFLASTGRVEIGNHSYDLHSNTARKGCKILANEGEEEYYNMLYADVGLLQSELYNKSGIRAVTFAYPFGYICDQSVPVLEELGFVCTLNCYEKPNYITKDIGCLYDINRYNRPSGISTEVFMKKITSAGD